MNILHGADLHKNREHYPELEASLDVFEAAAIREHVDLIALAGDLYDGAEQNSERDLLDPYAGRLQRLGDIAPVVAVNGTPSHDIPGSLDILQRLACKHGITILQPGIPYFLSSTGGIEAEAWSKKNPVSEGEAKLLIFGIPEPAKKWLLAGAQGAIGKDLVDAAVRDAMRALCLGLGGMRREHADLPCLVLYHGQVSGARTGTGYEAGSGIAISRDDLAAIDADYYALGDIHFPQQIPGLPAYYPGKFYAGDWREQNYKFGCNLVELRRHGGIGFDGDDLSPVEGYEALVSRVDFPHPERIKLATSWPEGPDAFDKPADVAGKLVWIEATVSQEKAAGFDAEASLAKLLSFGALPGSQVTVKRIPVETVRASEIAEKPSLEGKLEVYAEASGLTLAPGVYAKAGELEREVGTLEQFAGTPRQFRLVSTLLRGAKGFWRRQHKDEVFIDWEAAGPGVIAYIGPNGYGKTTSFDFSKPWPVPTSRKPKTLSKHFRLRESIIENIYLEELSGTRYKVHINIDGATKAGGAEYFLFSDGGQGWKPVDGCTGRQEPFLAAIDQIFGPMDIYMRTAYVAQNPTKDYPDIKDATTEEKKALIGELAGKDYSPYQEKAKEHREGIEAEVSRLDTVIGAAADVDEVLDRLAGELSAAIADQATAEAEGRTLAATETILAAEREALSLRVAEAERRATRRGAIDGELEEINRTLEAIAQEVEGFRVAAGGRAAAQAELDQLASLEEEAAKLRGEKTAHDAAHTAALASYQAQAKAIRDQQDEARRVLDSRRQERAAADQALALVRARIDPEAGGKAFAAAKEYTRLAALAQEATAVSEEAGRRLEGLRHDHAGARALAVLTGDLAEGATCPVCGSTSHPAPAHADAAALADLEAQGRAAADEAEGAGKALAEAVRARERAQATAEALARAAEAAEKASAELGPVAERQAAAQAQETAAEAALAVIVLPPPPEPVPFPAAERLADLEAELGFALPAGLRETIRQADEAVIRIEEAGRRQADAEERRARLAEERGALEPAPDEDQTSAALAAKGAELADTRRRLTEASAAAAAAQATVTAKASAIADNETRLKARQENEAKRKILAEELGEWQALERALVGIRDLELDALAPSIAEIATRLLQSSGDNGHIEIETTRTSSGSAKKAKQIEDFLIFYTGEDGEQQDIGTCSGGEMVWQRKALYDAFAVMRSRNAGLRFTTCLLDETDGALHPTRKQDYFRMLEAAHRESDRYQTILITQSAELSAMAQTVIDVTRLGPQEAKAAEAAE